MAVAINPTRKFKFQSEVDTEIKLWCEFNSEEDWQYKSTDTGLNILHRNIRQSFKKWEGFEIQGLEEGQYVEGPNGEELKNGDQLPVTEDSQKSILTWMLQNDKEMFGKVVDAYKGVASKKSKLGAMQSDSGTGDLSIVPDVKSEESVKPVSEQDTKKTSGQ